MSQSVNCILLVDDNKIDNFFHERAIAKSAAADHVIIKNSAVEALEYFKSGQVLPQVILLDINMPGLDGWGFIREYKKLGITEKCLIVIMISDFEEPDDEMLETVKDILSLYRQKPITKEILEGIIAEYHSK
jgi:CheY-like chemotaxis protein